MNSIKQATAFAPASVANIASGFDILGYSFDALGDTVIVEKNNQGDVEIKEISGVATGLPQKAAQNTATAGLLQMKQDLNLPFGFSVSIKKGIPLSSGMGGSAASAVAAIFAANALLENPLSMNEMLDYALIGEQLSSGSFHADNIAASLFGGIIFSKVDSSANQKKPSIQIHKIPTPPSLFSVVVFPNQALETKTARGILKKEIGLHQHISQAAHLSQLLIGCYTHDFQALRQGLKDHLIEPQRASLIPGFYTVQSAAIKAGALGCSISGAGPSVFAWATDEFSAEDIKNKMIQAFASENISSQGWVQKMNSQGARILK